MTKIQKVERIDYQTKYAHHRQSKHRICELLDLGYSSQEIREYFQMKHLEILQDIKDIAKMYDQIN